MKSLQYNKGTFIRVFKVIEIAESATVVKNCIPENYKFWSFRLNLVISSVGFQFFVKSQKVCSRQNEDILRRVAFRNGHEVAGGGSTRERALEERGRSIVMCQRSVTR